MKAALAPAKARGVDRIAGVLSCYDRVVVTGNAGFSMPRRLRFVRGHQAKKTQ
jgi:hypothetical protein